MSYADDLAKDRDKFRLQLNKVANHLYQVLDNDSPKTRQAARKALKAIFDAEEKASAELMARLLG
jgi:hypothetical protein